jgi:oligopeptide transport system ATP-binding protein
VREAMLDIRNLRAHFPLVKGLLVSRRAGTVRAVDGVSLAIGRREILGLVGESGCGKSTLARTIVGLNRAAGGSITIRGEEVIAATSKARRKLCREVQMVFQDPYASLNPRMTLFAALAEALRVKRAVPPREIGGAVAELMARVGLSARFAHKYPHELSGGQRQRVAVARALAVEPALIIADEPVSALDVSIRAQILNLLANLRKELGLSILFISHDLSVVNYLADRIAVMYLGRIVEVGSSNDVVDRPLHPYTRALVSAVPVPDPDLEQRRQRIILQGDPPTPANPPAGCRFHPRCPWAAEICSRKEPALETVGVAADSHTVACLRVKEIEATGVPHPALPPAV